MGDEYFANLDHIESVENFKEGYESEAHCSDSEGSGVDMSRVKMASSQQGKNGPKTEDRNIRSKGERSPEHANGNLGLIVNKWRSDMDVCSFMSKLLEEDRV